MNKFYAIFTLLACTCAAHAIPAIPWLIHVSQPDSTRLTVRLAGDEWHFHYLTDDGFPVAQCPDGSYVYQLVTGDSLTTSSVLAHNLNERSAQETAILNKLPKDICHKTSFQSIPTHHQATPRRNYDYSRFRGLVLLVNFNDRTLSMSNPVAYYQSLLNQREYAGYNPDDEYGRFTGSVRDYFIDNSGGKFDPLFDVVGPINVDRSIEYPHRTTNAPTLFAEVLQQVDEEVDFSQYDADGDGIIDMVYFIVAGPGANSGAPTSYLWPHKSSMAHLGIVYDGVKVDTYACSTETLLLNGVGSQEIPDGIGTICHEFSHVLGLPDLYDTDYSQSGGQSHHPGKWEIMASGGYLNNSRTPAGYSLYDKYTLGFTYPQAITATGEYTLQPLGTSHEGYLINSPIENEFFLIENRQSTKWDSYLPGHGMIVAHVDSTDTDMWDNKQINTDPTHNCYELLRAGESIQGDKSSDPFPGTEQVNELTNFTHPSLKTHDNLHNPFSLINITESGQLIGFTVTNGVAPYTFVEDFENMPCSNNKYETDVSGAFSQWDFNKCNVVAPDDTTMCQGSQALAMYKNGEALMTDTLTYSLNRITLRATNPNNTVGMLHLYYMLPGSEWQEALDINQQLGVMLVAATTMQCMYDLQLDERVLLKLVLTGGSSTKACYIDDVTLLCTTDLNGGTLLPGDLNGDGVIDVTDVNIIINVILGKAADDGCCDLNNDDAVDVTDVNMLINIILGKN